MILALRTWGEQWCKPAPGGPATQMFHKTCGAELELNGRCPKCEVLVDWPEMRGQPSQAWAEERARRAVEFVEHRKGGPQS